MALTRKRHGRREIRVRDCTYIWRIEMEDSWLYVQERDHVITGRLQVFPVDHLANQLFVYVTEPMLETAYGTNIVTPKIADDLIQGALDRGWEPAKTSFWISLQEAQAILDARPDKKHPHRNLTNATSIDAPQ